MNDLYTIVEFDKNDKWFVAYVKEINNAKYSYLIKINENEDDFLEEYQVVKSFYENDDEYMDTVTDKEELEKIMPILVPDLSMYTNESKRLLEILKKQSN